MNNKTGDRSNKQNIRPFSSLSSGLCVVLDVFNLRSVMALRGGFCTFPRVSQQLGPKKAASQGRVCVFWCSFHRAAGFVRSRVCFHQVFSFAAFSSSSAPRWILGLENKRECLDDSLFEGRRVC